MSKFNVVDNGYGKILLHDGEDHVLDFIIDNGGLCCGMCEIGMFEISENYKRDFLLEAFNTIIEWVFKTERVGLIVITDTRVKNKGTTGWFASNYEHASRVVDNFRNPKTGNTIKVWHIRRSDVL